MRIIITILVLLLAPALQAQVNVSGKIIFASDNKPVTGASVFFSNTSIGTVSAQDGRFTLQHITPGNYNLVVSYIGYETVQRTINITNIPIDNIVISLTPKQQLMDAVVVGGYEKQTWEKWGRFFTEQFIGAGSWGEKCILENKEQVEFRFYKKKNMLVAYAGEDLVIVNKNLGYRIRYRLEKFEYDFTKGMLFYEGYPFFEDMDSKRKGRVRRWMKARNEAYYGSVMHFMRSVYRNRLIQDGFEIRRLVKTPNDEKKRVQQLYRDRAKFLSNQNGPGEPLQADSAAYYEKILKQKDSFDQYTPYTIAGDSIAYALDSFTAVVEFKNYLYVVYKNALEDIDYAKSYTASPGLKNPSSAIRLLNHDQILVFSNGAYDKMQDMLTNGYWAWSEKICRLLPYDFKPLD
ncbi:MAG: carboxypeptidase-like regulatory domain-containing protein [Ferruginibacter sp.]